MNSFVPLLVDGKNSNLRQPSSFQEVCVNEAVVARDFLSSRATALFFPGSTASPGVRRRGGKGRVWRMPRKKASLTYISLCHKSVDLRNHIISTIHLSAGVLLARAKGGDRPKGRKRGAGTSSDELVRATRQTFFFLYANE